MFVCKHDLPIWGDALYFILPIFSAKFNLLMGSFHKIGAIDNA